MKGIVVKASEKLDNINDIVAKNINLKPILVTGFSNVLCILPSLKAILMPVKDKTIIAYGIVIAPVGAQACRLTPSKIISSVFEDQRKDTEINEIGPMDSSKGFCDDRFDT